MITKKEVFELIVINRINNNVVLAKDGDQRKIVTGKGLGFQVYPNDVIDDCMIEQCYILQVQDNLDYYIDIIKKIPANILDTSRKIVDLASGSLQKECMGNLIFSLADHINFSLDRLAQQIRIDHPLAIEIKQFYPKEMAIGLQALDIIKQDLHAIFPSGEAVFITMHIINATGGLSEKYDVSCITEMMKASIDIVEQKFNIKINQETPAFYRFITHLRYYLIRQINFEIEESINDELLQVIQEKYPDAYTCATRITDTMYKQYHFKTIDSEKLYLTLHINRIIKENKGEDHEYK